MMDGRDYSRFSMSCRASCAAHVHVSIALSRTASCAFRCDGTYRFAMGVLVFAGDEISIVANSQELDVLLKGAVRS